MFSKRRTRRTVGIAVMLAASTSAASLAMTTAGHAILPPIPKVYYLALGDSLGAGYQPNLIGHCPQNPQPATGGCSTKGYVGDVYKYYKKAINNTTNVLILENLSCPGESTATMVTGGICTYSTTPSLNNQLAAAETFIKTHDVAFITIDIGANDVDGCAGYVTTNPADPNYATDVPACVTSGAVDATYGVNADGIAGIDTNLPNILTGLENAETASTKSVGAPIYGMNYYDPFLALYLEAAYTGPTGFAEQSASLAGTLNSHLASDYAAATTPGPTAVADVQSLFKTTDGNPPPTTYTPVTNLFATPTDPVNVQSICNWTWECTTYQNIHANNNGYAAMATSFEQVMGALP